MKISILDMSPIHVDNTPKQALNETLEIAQIADKLGYYRFWVSEHHALDSVAGCTPEILVANIGAITNNIRIGSGGVMLPHYSTYKVAETFSLLSTLYDGRVDLGVGRAAGGDMRIAKALASDGIPKFERFPEQVKELQEILGNPDSQPLITARPEIPTPIWMLGTGSGSASLAAQMGLPYNFALFINGADPSQVFELYKNKFKPSAQLDKPYTNIAINILCADTEEEAKRLAKSRSLLFLKLHKQGFYSRLPSVEEADAYNYSEQDLAIIKNSERHSIIGAPEQVKEKITTLQKRYNLDEIMAVTSTYDFEARKYSFKLLAEVMKLS